MGGPLLCSWSLPHSKMLGHLQSAWQLPKVGTHLGQLLPQGLAWPGTTQQGPQQLPHFLTHLSHSARLQPGPWRDMVQPFIAVALRAAKPQPETKAAVTCSPPWQYPLLQAPGEWAAIRVEDLNPGSLFCTPATACSRHRRGQLGTAGETSHPPTENGGLSAPSLSSLRGLCLFLRSCAPEKGLNAFPPSL
jgi:hypothetical protein